MTKNPILTHFGHVSRGGLYDIPQDVDLDPDRLRFACQGHGMAQKWHFWTKIPKSQKPLRWSNYNTRIHCETTQTGPQVTKMPFGVKNDMTQGMVRLKPGPKPRFFQKNHQKSRFFHFLKKSEKTSFSSKFVCILGLQNRPPPVLKN